MARDAGVGPFGGVLVIARQPIQRGGALVGRVLRRKVLRVLPDQVVHLVAADGRLGAAGDGPPDPAATARRRRGRTRAARRPRIRPSRAPAAGRGGGTAAAGCPAGRDRRARRPRSGPRRRAETSRGPASPRPAASRPGAARSTRSGGAAARRRCATPAEAARTGPRSASNTASSTAVCAGPATARSSATAWSAGSTSNCTVCASSRRPQPGPARDQHRAVSAAGQQRADLLLVRDVVQHDQGAGIGEQVAVESGARVERGRDLPRRNAERLQDHRQRVGGLARLQALRVAVQVEEQLPVRVTVGQQVRGVQRERGLADPAHPVDRADHDGAHRLLAVLHQRRSRRGPPRPGR